VTTGAPRSTKNTVDLRVIGRGIPQEGTQGRNFFTDIQNAVRWLRRDPLTTERGSLRVQFATVPRRWADIPLVWSDPVLDPEGNTDFRAAVDLAPTEPALARAQSGLLGAGVWVAGVVSGTRPALVLDPADAPGSVDAAPIEPLERSVWAAPSGPAFALFAFDVLDPEVTYSPSFWLDEEDRRAGRPPDATLSPFSVSKRED
jgi:hypothetical protein